MGVVLVSHDWGVVAEACERAVVMYAGQVVEWGSVDDLFEQPRHPYTEALFSAHPHNTSAARLTVIPGRVPPPQEWLGGCRFAPRCPYASADCAATTVPARRLGGEQASRCLYPERVGRRAEAVDA